MVFAFIFTLLLLSGGIYGIPTTDETSETNAYSITPPDQENVYSTAPPVDSLPTENYGPASSENRVDVMHNSNYGGDESSQYPKSPVPPQSNQPCEIGECVPYYLCLNGSIITDGAGILDSRLGADDDPEPAKHPCPDFFDTCCSLTTKDKDTFTEVIDHIPVHEKCGVRNMKGAGFEISPHANEAQYAEFPWVVALIQKVDDHGDSINLYKCGGTLIHPSVVMTAAHCVLDIDPRTLTARAGEWDTQTTDEPYPHQDRIISEIIIHEHYKRGSHFNDIALLMLEKPVDLKENVNTACLPPQDNNFDHQHCHATGWGKDKFGQGGLYQVILKLIGLPVVPHRECQDKLRTTRLGRHFELDHSFICAGGEKGIDVCTGDGGSPLVCEIQEAQGRYYQAGIVAWGIGCGDAIPGVYVNVAKFRYWVDEFFDSRILDKKFYTAF